MFEQRSVIIFFSYYFLCLSFICLVVNKRGWMGFHLEETKLILQMNYFNREYYYLWYYNYVNSSLLPFHFLYISSHSTTSETVFALFDTWERERERKAQKKRKLKQLDLICMTPIMSASIKEKSVWNSLSSLRKTSSWVVSYLAN